MIAPPQHAWVLETSCPPNDPAAQIARTMELTTVHDWGHRGRKRIGGLKDRAARQVDQGLYLCAAGTSRRWTLSVAATDRAMPPAAGKLHPAIRRATWFQHGLGQPQLPWISTSLKVAANHSSAVLRECRNLPQQRVQPRPKSALGPAHRSRAERPALWHNAVAPGRPPLQDPPIVMTCSMSHIRVSFPCELCRHAASAQGCTP